MRMNDALTIEFVRSVLDFDPETGIFTWKVVQSNRIKVGERAGVVATNGRRYISVCGEKIMAHRLAWFHFHGEWPKGDVKQKNQNYDDCSIENLIDQPRQVTASSRKLNASSKSGYPGVSWDSRRERWQVHITRDYKQVAVGSFDDLSTAIAARKEAEAHQGISVSDDAKVRAAHTVARRRRQRMAWEKLSRLGEPLGWNSLDDFCTDIGDIPETKMALVAIDAARPIGPRNFRWSLPTELKHDFKTQEGRKAYGQAHRAANPDLYREMELRKKFNIGVAEYDAMLAAQDGVCDICKKPEAVVIRGKVIFLSVDHDHDTGAVRGLLCSHCNHAIGKFGDDVELLSSAASYLRKHAAPNVFMCDMVADVHHAAASFGVH